MTSPGSAEKSAINVGRDIVRFGTAITLTVALGAAQVFVLPRRLEMETFGEYRLFMVYVAYVGLLHFGLADGAFVRWAGKSTNQIRREWTRVFRWMTAIECGVLALAIFISYLTRSRVAATILIGIGACALAVNLSTLSAYALQAAGDFRDAGIVAVIGPAGFVAAIVLLPTNTLATVLVAYSGTMGISALVGSLLVARLRHDASGDDSSPLSMSTLMHSGRHVLGANLAAGLAQSVDRMLVTMLVPMTSFALYGFASSVSVAGISATQTMSRVALSHAARREGDERARFLGKFYDLTLAAYGVALVGLPLFERIVSRVVPAYVDALPMVRAFVAGAPFWIALHVVIVGTLQSYHRVRRQFAIELGGAALVAAACGACLLLNAPMWVVASVASIAAAATWAGGVAALNAAVPAARTQGAMRFFSTCVLQSAAIGVAFSVTQNWKLQTALYVLLATIPTAVAARAARSALRAP